MQRRPFRYPDEYKKNSDSTCIKDKKTIVHLTALENIENIFLSKKLLSRAMIKPKIDVADPEIIKKREKDNLEHYVPFHFFMKNPFDGVVIKNYPSQEFIYLAVKRDIAKKNNFFIIPKHPLSDTENIELLSYDEGFKKIDWELMETRNYQDQNCKHTCMAECLALNEVPLSMVFSIAVQSELAMKKIKALTNKYPEVYTGHLNLKPEYFPKP